VVHVFDLYAEAEVSCSMCWHELANCVVVVG